MILFGNGLQALQSNTSGMQNTAIGVNAILFNTIGNFNIAVGSAALEMNTIGNDNTATGFQQNYGDGSGFMVPTSILNARAAKFNVTFDF